MYATTWEGRHRRAYFGSLPVDWMDQPLPLPLVIVLHDEHSHLEELMIEGSPTRVPGIGRQFLHLIFQRTTAERRNLPSSYAEHQSRHAPETFLLLAPEGTSLGRQEPLADLEGTAGGCSWNCGHRGFEAKMFRPDDTGYIHHLIDLFQERAEALIARWDPYLDPSVPRQLMDLDRIYVVGVGNGGMMAYRLACELPARNPAYHVRAMAVLGGSTGGWYTRRRFDTNHAPRVNDPADRSRFPVEPLELDLMVIHRRQDDSVPFDPDNEGHRSADSVSEFDRLRNDLGSEDLARRHTPRAFTPRRSVDIWRSWLAARCGAETTDDVYTTTLPEGYQREVHHHRYPSSRASSGSVHLWTQWEEELGQPTDTSLWSPRYSPSFGVAREIWEFFRDPSRLYDWPDLDPRSSSFDLDDLLDDLGPPSPHELLP